MEGTAMCLDDNICGTLDGDNTCADFGGVKDVYEVCMRECVGTCIEDCPAAGCRTRECTFDYDLCLEHASWFDLHDETEESCMTYECETKCMGWADEALCNNNCYQEHYCEYYEIEDCEA